MLLRAGGGGSDKVRGACLISPVNSPGFDQTIPNNTNTLVLFTAFWGGRVLFDTDNAADMANSQIIVPSWANWINISAHLAYQPQLTAAGLCDIHLFRNAAPTGEQFLHNVVYYPLNQPVSLGPISTGWKPVTAVNEAWTLIARQSSGGAADISTSQPNAWLAVYFKK